MYLLSTNHKKALMNKVHEILTPNLHEFVEEIVKHAKQGYRVDVTPQLLGWQYYCQMIQEATSEVVTTATIDAPKPRGPKPKKATTPTEA